MTYIFIFVIIRDMKRLLQIGSSTLAMSLIPIICWFLLGVTLDSNIINVFSLTYSIWFLSQVIVYIFAVGANIKKEKENNENAVLSGMVLGTIVCAVFTAIFLFNIDNYITFMSMDVGIYKTFTIYSFTYFFINTIFTFVLHKYYFEGKEKQANIHSICFNLLNLACLVGVSLITKNQVLIITIALVVSAVYALIFFFKQFRKFKLDFNILTNIKYESADILYSLILFATYFFGYSNAFSAGQEYVIAINFVALITDSQWDCCEAISTCAKIDIAKGEYNYKVTRKNALIYSGLLALSSVALFFALYNVYGVDLKFGLIYLFMELILFLFNHIDYGFEPFVQLEFSATVNTTRSIISNVIRFILSAVILNAFCTQIGMVVSCLFSNLVLILIKFIFYKQEKDGTLTRKQKKIS